jgi:hypothetical protein
MMKIVLLMKEYTGLHIDIVNIVTMNGNFNRKYYYDDGYRHNMLESTYSEG